MAFTQAELQFCKSLLAQADEERLARAYGIFEDGRYEVLPTRPRPGWIHATVKKSGEEPAVYHVEIFAEEGYSEATCECMDYQCRRQICKHILYICSRMLQKTGEE